MHKQYFAFLRYCLCPTGPRPEVEDTDWKDLYRFAEAHKLIGVFFVGVRRLPAGMVPADVLLRFMQAAESIRRANLRVSRVAGKVVSDLEAAGFRTLLLKGQGNALLYPDPNMRTPGDVDMLVLKTEEDGTLNLDASANTVLAYGREVLKGGKAIYHHIEAPAVEGIGVEIHYRPSWRSNPVHNRRLQRWFGQVLAHECTNVRKVEADGQTVRFSVPSADFNAVYQLCHLSNHVLQSGVGLRQLVDYYVLLMNRELHPQVKDLIVRFGLARFAGALMWMLEHLLGLPREKMVAEPVEATGRILLKVVMEHGKRKNRNQGALAQNWARLVRDVKLMRLMGWEAVCEPGFRLWHYAWRMRFL